MFGDITRGCMGQQVWRIAATATILVVAFASGLQPAAAIAGDAVRRTRAADDAVRSAALAEAIGATYNDAARGLDCVIGNLAAGDFYDIDLFPGCGDDGLFARTVAAATAFDTLPVTGSRARARATLPSGQLLCVHAIARSGQVVAYYHATPVQPSSIAACRANRLCESPGPRGKADASDDAATACAVDAGGLPTGNCPEGRIDADAVDLFSNGL